MSLDVSHIPNKVWHWLYVFFVQEKEDHKLYAENVRRKMGE